MNEIKKCCDGFGLFGQCGRGERGGCTGVHCRCMEKDCLNMHYVDCKEHYIHVEHIEPVAKLKVKHGMFGVLKFTEDSPFYKNGEKERTIENLTEIHYNYSSAIYPSTAFESDIEGTGFTVQNRYIKEFEVFIS